MQEQISHWRKRWPEGAIDDSTNDEDVLNLLGEPKKKKKKEEVTFPWSYDEDVIETEESLKVAEKLTHRKLHLEAVHDGGLDLLERKYDELGNPKASESV